MTDIFPVIRYRDAHAGIGFLVNAFGFEKHAVYEDDGVVEHAELRYGDGIVMVGQREQVDPPPSTSPSTTPMPTTSGQRPPARRSSASSPTRSTARASTAPKTRRATSGASGPTGRAERPDAKLSASN
jgi:hypothetical protein